MLLGAGAGAQFPKALRALYPHWRQGRLLHRGRRPRGGGEEHWRSGTAAGRTRSDSRAGGDRQCCHPRLLGTDVRAVEVFGNTGGNNDPYHVVDHPGQRTHLCRDYRGNVAAIGNRRGGVRGEPAGHRRSTGGENPRHLRRPRWV